MTNNDVKKQALAFVESQNPLVMSVGTLAANGKPEIKAMVKFCNDGLKTFLFCSNTSARRTKELQRDNRACLYAYEYAPEANPMICRGIMLSGTIELSWDDDLRKSLWQDFLTMYYPQGPLDPEFVVYTFTAESGNYYEGLTNTDFTV
ncbi:MAG: pyridoxamine 5'-phosphate oxidase family protein [Thermoguttaceae bacterium]